MEKGFEEFIQNWLDKHKSDNYQYGEILEAYKEKLENIKNSLYKSHYEMMESVTSLTVHFYKSIFNFHYKLKIFGNIWRRNGYGNNI